MVPPVARITTLASFCWFSTSLALTPAGSNSSRAKAPGTKELSAAFIVDFSSGWSLLCNALKGAGFIPELPLVGFHLDSIDFHGLRRVGDARAEHFPIRNSEYCVQEVFGFPVVFRIIPTSTDQVVSGSEFDKTG
ncbi:hypothetical protein D3C79_874490 [compost metagenome]